MRLRIWSDGVLTFMQLLLKVIVCQSLVFSNADGNANEKLKQDAQTENADGMQAMPALHMTQLEATPHK